MNKVKAEVLVVGAGIIGTSIGAELAKRNHQVLVIDQGEVGKGCSYGNAGWMTPCFAMPLPMPGMLLKSMKWLLNPNSPLHIRPSLSVDLAAWLFRFMQSMNKAQAHRAVECLVALSKKSLDEYEKLAQNYPEIRFEKKGLLMVGREQAGVDVAVEELDYVKDFGVTGCRLSQDEILNMEPALKAPLKGGVYFDNEAMAEPLLVVQALVKDILKHRGTVLEHTPFKDFVIENGRITKVLAGDLEIEADQVIMATGGWSKELAKKMQLRVPILGGKGYAMIVPPLKKQPKHPIMLVEKKIAITPREKSLRIAGTLELVDQDFSISERRVKNIEKGAREFLEVPETLEIQELWRGLRPCTPDGVPMIGTHQKIHNLTLAAGHQMLGLQSGLGTGILVADMLEKKTPYVDARLLDIHRF